MSSTKQQIQGENKKVRESNIEFLRIVAMLLIVGCHFATHGGFSFDSSSVTVPRIWWHILELGGNFGTDLFVMISGYFLIKDVSIPPKMNKIILFWLQIIFYSVILFFLAFPLGYGDSSLKNILMSVLPISYSAWWFASAYFVLYLLHPYINLALNAMDKKQYGIFLLVLIIIWSIIPLLTTSDFQSNNLIELFLMYAIAGYIRKFGLFEKASAITWAGLWIVFTILAFLSSLILLIIGTKISVASSHSTYFYTRTCILTIARAVTFFMLFLKIDIGRNNIINKISSAMFGVYLLHDSKLLRKFLWLDFFDVSSYKDTLKIIPYSIFVVGIVFVSCILIEFLRQLCIETPIKKLFYRKSSG